MARDSEVVPLTGTSLAGIEIFSELSAADRNDIAERCHGRRFAPESQIVSHQDDAGDVYFLVSGDVRVTYYSATGKEITFRDQHAGEIFGELSAIDGAGRSAYVVALSEALIATMPRASFLRTLRDYPAVAMATLNRLTRLVRLLSDRVVEFSTLAVRNRIHAELARLAAEYGVEANAAHISPTPKHADIASRVSTHREAVTRELKDLERAGLIERHENTLTIHDVEALQRLVREVS